MPGWDTGSGAFGSDILGLFGNSTDLISSSIGLFGDSDNEDHQRTINSMGILGGLSGMVSSGKDFLEASDENSKSGMAQSGFGMTAGAFNTIAGTLGLGGKDKESDFMYGLGGLAGMGESGIGLVKNIHSAAKDKKKTTANKIGDLLSSGGGLVGSLGGALMGFGGAFGSEDSSTVKAGKWLSFLGSGAGLIGNAINAIGRTHKAVTKAKNKRRADPTSPNYDPIEVLRDDDA